MSTASADAPKKSKRDTACDVKRDAATGIPFFSELVERSIFRKGFQVCFGITNQNVVSIGILQLKSREFVPNSVK